MNRTILESFIKVCAWLLPAIILFFVFYHRPFWGLMDDATNVFYMIPLIRSHGVFRHAIDYGLDFSWGMFRPTYPLMVYLIYTPGMAIAPWVSFLWNALLVFAMLWFYTKALSKILKISPYVILLVEGAFFYGHDLFHHISLQEKMILTAGAGLVWHCWNRERWKAWNFWLVAAAWLALGLSSKSSFVIHLSVAVVTYASARAGALKRRDRKAWAEALLLLVALAASVAFFAHIAGQAAYTNRYGIAKVWPNLFSIDGALFALPILAGVFWCSFRWRDTWECPEILIPLTGVAAFFMLFLPWGIQGYIQCVITPLYGALIAQLGFWYLRRLPMGLWLIPLAVFSVSITFYRSYVNFGRLHDVGNTVAHAADLQQEGVEVIWVPCAEAAVSMARFFESSKSSLIVKELQWSSPAAKGKTLFYDRSSCPLPGRLDVPADCVNSQLLLPGSFPKSFRVLRCQ